MSEEFFLIGIEHKIFEIEQKDFFKDVWEFEDGELYGTRESISLPTGKISWKGITREGVYFEVHKQGKCLNKKEKSEISDRISQYVHKNNIKGYSGKIKFTD